MKLFISYSHKNKDEVRQLAELLEEDGHKVWWDDRLDVGSLWQKQLANEIATADGFVYALSPDSIISEWCQFEFTQAVSKQKRIIPVKIVAIPDDDIPASIKQYQYIDLSNRSLEQQKKLLHNLSANAVNIALQNIKSVLEPPSSLSERELAHFYDVKDSTAVVHGRGGMAQSTGRGNIINSGMSTSQLGVILIILAIIVGIFVLGDGGENEVNLAATRQEEARQNQTSTAVVIHELQTSTSVALTSIAEAFTDTPTLTATNTSTATETTLYTPTPASTYTPTETAIPTATETSTPTPVFPPSNTTQMNINGQVVFIDNLSVQPRQYVSFVNATASNGEFLYDAFGEDGWMWPTTASPVPELIPSVDNNTLEGSVSWYEAFAYCYWRGGRLPTFEEWEFAYQSGIFGDDSVDKLQEWLFFPPSIGIIEYSYVRINSRTGEIIPQKSSPEGNFNSGLARFRCVYVVS